MSLIDKINASVVVKMAGGASSNSSSSKINGKGAGTSFNADAVSLSDSLKNFAIAFRDSDSRLLSPQIIFGASRGLLDKLSSVTDELINVAKRASLEETSTEERSTLEIRFQKLIREYKDIQNSSTVNDIDLLSKSDLKDSLTNASVSLSTITELGKAFEQLAPKDGKLGHTLLKTEDVVVVSHDGSVEVGRGKALGDPLNQTVVTRSDATMAYNTLLKLKDDLKDDMKNVSNIIKELSAADRFAIAGNSASVNLLDAPLSAYTSQSLAIELVRGIKREARDNNISQHSDIDTALATTLIA